jgi:hypothetical protein
MVASPALAGPPFAATYPSEQRDWSGRLKILHRNGNDRRRPKPSADRFFPVSLSGYCLSEHPQSSSQPHSRLQLQISWQLQRAGDTAAHPQAAWPH